MSTGYPFDYKTALLFTKNLEEALGTKMIQNDTKLDKEGPRGLEGVPHEYRLPLFDYKVAILYTKTSREPWAPK